MNSGAYTITSSFRGHGLVKHFPGGNWLLADGYDDTENARIELTARVRSGDYFMTLATELEKLVESGAAQKNGNTVDAFGPELDRIISELIYLSQHFTITKK